MKTSFQWAFDKQNYFRFFHFKLTWLSWPFSSPPILPRHWCQGSSSLVIKCHVRPCQFFFDQLRIILLRRRNPALIFPPRPISFPGKGKYNHALNCHKSSSFSRVSFDLCNSYLDLYNLARGHRNIVKLWTISLWQVVLGLSNSFGPIGTRTLGASTLHESLGNKR